MKFCDRPFKFLHMFPDGECRACPWMSGNIGNLIEEDLHDIWHSEKAEQIRDAMRHGNFEYCHKTSCPILENDSVPDVDETVALNAVAENLPTHYSVACDFICNHTCPSCRQDIFMPDEQYVKDLKTMLSKLEPAMQNAKYILTSGNGDPLASPYMMDMLERLHPSDPECEIVIQTNGTMFDEAHWERIKHLGKYPFSVLVTPNSFQKRTYEYLCGGHKTYEKLLHCLHFMRGLRETGEVDKLEIIMVMQESNFREIPEFCERAIHEFKADFVTIRPIYHWFKLPRDEYWFKDVMNPSHPYHKQAQEVMSDPILDDPHVFLWGARNLHKDIKHPAYMFKEHMALTARLMEDPKAPQKLAAYLHSQGVNSLYIHGDQDLATVFYKLLAQTDIQVRGFTAKYVHQPERCGQPVQPICDWTPDDVDAMLVIRYEFMYKIVNDFNYMGFKGKLIPADRLVDEALGQ